MPAIILRPCRCGCGVLTATRDTRGRPRLGYVSGHNATSLTAFVARQHTPPRPTKERFWPKVLKTGYCWIWQGARNSAGYGQIWDGERVIYAHRFSWETENGPIAPTLTIDHLCRVPACVNPAHLEVVTYGENSLRGENPAFKTRRTGVCKNGHTVTNENTLRVGHLICRECFNATRRRRAARLATAAHKEGE